MVFLYIGAFRVCQDVYDFILVMKIADKLEWMQKSGDVWSYAFNHLKYDEILKIEKHDTIAKNAHLDASID